MRETARQWAGMEDDNGGNGLQRGTRELFRVTWIARFYILIAVTVTDVYTFITTH